MSRILAAGTAAQAQSYTAPAGLPAQTTHAVSGR
ncbi:hypothetical protein LKMONMHP_2254 [Methylobacterium organophilum]|uniref:Uncharacterized protein n=1 Tax=Methylobacterium organophilum TaxID=410 RepID=A0ABQ4T942_METOR|nr:hypothetical protein LKMONMHP_2254 [Methylobacterium organophilum]